MQIEKITKENIASLLSLLAMRNPSSYPKEEAAVKQILTDVSERGDTAVFSYTQKFDGAILDASTIRVTESEVEEAYQLVDADFIRILRLAIDRITAYHNHQKEKSWFVTEEDGSLLGQRVIPIERAGVYVPGGRASYPSSLLMNVIPARVAGVREIILCTPCGADGKVAPSTLVAAKEAGVSCIYKVGGAQAIAAMAFGTESIPKVDKITGPGNIYVALAKKAVFGHVSIDSVAGPSEILVLADETGNARYIAADLLSQAEHDPMASAVLVTTSEDLAREVAREIDAMVPTLTRKEIITASLSQYGRILVAPDSETAIFAVNEIASEHLEIHTKYPFADMAKIRNAGAVFIGEYASEPLGDYMAGPNHILPTCGTARFFSALSVNDFVKKSSVIYFTQKALLPLHKEIETFAETEGLTAHAKSIAVRFEKEGES